LEQQYLPLWVSKGTTYTQVQQFCTKQYAKQHVALIATIKENLEKLEQVEDVPSTFQVLHALNEAASDLYCFNMEWESFALAVFASIVFPRSRAWTILFLKASFKDTLRRLHQ
jgi:hypothetical protein